MTADDTLGTQVCSHRGVSLGLQSYTILSVRGVLSSRRLWEWSMTADLTMTADDTLGTQVCSRWLQTWLQTWSMTADLSTVREEDSQCGLLESTPRCSVIGESPINLLWLSFHIYRYDTYSCHTYECVVSHIWMSRVSRFRMMSWLHWFVTTQTDLRLDTNESVFRTYTEIDLLLLRAPLQRGS